jgi:FkbM family methyltransferase
MGIQTKLCKHGLFSYFTNDIIIGKSLEMYGEYAENEFLLLNHVIQPGDFVIDIGANLGLHTVWFAKHAFKGRVAAFEPNEFNRNLLIKNIDQNQCKNVQIYGNIVGDRNGSGFISSFNPSIPGNYGECSVLEANPGGLYEAKPMVKIDALNFGRCDFIKIDVEGYEKEVLTGCQETIKRCRPQMLVEINNSTTHLEFMWDMLHELDYLLWWLPVRNYNPTNFFGNRVNIFSNGGIIDIFAGPREKTPIHELDGVLEPVEGFDDTYQKMYKRVMNNIKLRQKPINPI